MKKIVFGAFIPLLFLFSGCEVGGLRGNGHIVTQRRSVEAFSNLDAEGAFHLEWRSGPTAVALTVDDNLLPYIETQTSGNTLRLRTSRSLRPRHAIKVVISSNALEGVELNGASRLTARGLSGPKFYLESNGATKVIADGTVTELIANMSGASDLNAESLQTKTAQLVVNGAGKATVAVSDALKVSIAGAGKVEYIGNPAHVEREIAGAGTIRRRE